MIQTLVRQFHRAFGAPTADSFPVKQDRDLMKLRIQLIEEEYFELIDALHAHDPIAIADALGDLTYVVYGCAESYGIDLDAVVQEIHRSNMTKLGADGKPIYREDGKVLKGPWFEEPDLAPIVTPQSLDAHRETAA